MKKYTITLIGRSDLITEFLKLDEEEKSIKQRKEEIIELLHTSELITDDV